MEEFSRVFPEWMKAGSEHLHRRADGAARGAEHNLERSVWGSAAKPTLQGQPDPAPGLFQAFRVSLVVIGLCPSSAGAGAGQDLLVLETTTPPQRWPLWILIFQAMEGLGWEAGASLLAVSWPMQRDQV